FSVGYTNASWTLKCDLVAKYVCRLLNHMDARGYAYCTPRPPGPGVDLSPVIDLDAGYVRRAVDRLPRQGARAPWRLRQNYPYDVAMLRWGPVDDGIDFVATSRSSPSQAGRPTPSLRA
ncbi:MAG: FAD-containing monooxygenase EthA, partial [Thermoleophilia bacterium]|nr:FAD-containing monooxygenase EthA [Thermoleophilia bacterium]